MYINDKKLFLKLDYNYIKDKLKSKCSNSITRNYCDELLPSTDIDKVSMNLDLTDEAVTLITKTGNKPIFPIYKVSDYVKRASIGGLLEYEQLLNIADTLSTVSSLKKNSYINKSEMPIFSDMINRLVLCNNLYKKITSIIIDESTMDDRASNELYKIRIKINEKANKINEKFNSYLKNSNLSQYLQDNIITYKSGRQVIPVKSEHKNKISGVVHEVSGSGVTLYIEPQDVITLNNEIATLKVEETKEINKILLMLSEEVKENSLYLIENEKILLDIDIVLAKAEYSLEIDGHRPKINNKKYINLKKARHPKIDKSEVMPIDIFLGKDFNVLIITGPNTGGKTVSMKTLGLFSLMAQSGFLIPCESSSEICIFDNIFADIGDEQSIDQSLSTFSSHMVNIIDITKKVTSDSLVLLDELCAGTDPEEGAAIAISIIDYFRKRKCITFATTHYSKLKHYATNTQGVENGSVEFDTTTLSPTYKLLIGIPGKSNAFYISQKLGLSDEILNAGKELMSDTEINFEEVLEKLEQSRYEADSLKEEALKYKKDSEELKSKYEKKYKDLQEKSKKEIESAKEKAQKIYKQAKEKADKSIKEIRSIEKELDKKTSKRLEDIRHGLIDDIKSVNVTKLNKEKSDNKLVAKDIILGQQVKVISMNLEGSIISLPDKNNDVVVQLGLMKSKVNIKDIATVKQEKSTKKKKGSSLQNFNKISSINTELDIRGLEGAEAIPVVDKYLDDVMLSGLKNVRIIHGKGSGILRSIVHSILKQSNYVVKYNLAHPNNGGDGATEIEMK